LGALGWVQAEPSRFSAIAVFATNCRQATII
jgi:hypothetical protein